MTRTSSYCRVPDCQAPTSGFLCKVCARELELAIADMTSLRHEVSLLATKQTRVYRANGKTDPDLDELSQLDEEYAWRTARIPAHLRSSIGRVTLPQTATMVNLAARDLLTTADTLLVGWARVLHEATDTTWELDTTEGVIVWLADKAESFRWHEAGAVAHAEILDLQRKLRRAVDRAPSKVYAGPCNTELDDGSTCRRPLYAAAPPHFDSDLDRDRWWRDHPIVCDGYRPPFDRSDGWDPRDKGCEAVHDRNDRREWMIAELEDRLLPLSLLMDTLPSVLGDVLHAIPPRSVINAWVRQKRLVPRTLIEDVEFFRGGDLITLMIAYRPHKYAPRQRRSA